MYRLFILSVLICLVNSNKLPPQFKRCSIKDEACLLEAVMDGIRHLKGIPELGVSSLNPFYVPKLSVPAGPKVVRVEQNFKNVEISGYDRAKVTKVDFNVNGGKVHFEFFLPSYVLKGDYDFDGQVLGVPMKGKGKCLFEFTNSSCIQDFETEVYKKDGEEFLKFKNSTLQITHVDNVYIRYDNLYDGDEKKNSEMNKMMNTRWKEIFGEIAPMYLERIAIAHLRISNELFSKVT